MSLFQDNQGLLLQKNQVARLLRAQAQNHCDLRENLPKSERKIHPKVGAKIHPKVSEKPPERKAQLSRKILLDKNPDV